MQVPLSLSLFYSALDFVLMTLLFYQMMIMVVKGDDTRKGYTCCSDYGPFDPERVFAYEIVKNLQVHRLHFVVSKFISIPHSLSLVNKMKTAFPVFVLA